MRADSPAGDARIDALIRQMTLAEKLGQLSQEGGGEPRDEDPAIREQRLAEVLGKVRDGAAGVLLGAAGADYTNRLQRCAVEESRLKIPVLFANDVIHGYRTIFPIPLGEAATWNPALIERACLVAAREARADGTHWTFAPMIDVCRDPRWGRIAETAGEDPFLGATIAAARVRGFQGKSLADPERVMACGKHFVAYGAAEGGRDYNTVDLSLQTLHEVHLRTFKAAVDAGVGGIMTSFNEVNGVPATGNTYTLNNVLRDDWGFKGVVISDYSSITEMIAHGFSADRADAARKALRAGVDIDMISGAYREQLPALAADGAVSMAEIDRSVRRVLAAKTALGLFDQPFVDAGRVDEILLASEHRALARETARQSLVLLKNEASVLPIRPDVRRISLIGPLADNRRDILGTWNIFGRQEDAVTILAGLRETAGDGLEIRHERGCDTDGPLPGGLDAAIAAAGECDLVILAIGESEDMAGEGRSRSKIELPAAQLKLAEAVIATGRPVVVVLFCGRPMAVPWLAEHAAALLVAWHPGTESGHALADVLMGSAIPGGRLPVSMPQSTGQIPVYYNHKNTGRPPVPGERYTSQYQDMSRDPLFPFGFGLSYVQFEYDNLLLDSNTVSAAGVVRLNVDVRNTGARHADEVVQVYYRDPVASMTRPVRQLCGFQRISVPAHETRVVSLTVPVREFGFYDAGMQFVVEPGPIELFVGGDSRAALKQIVTILER